MQRRLIAPFILAGAAIIFAAWVSAEAFSSSPSSSDDYAHVDDGDVCVGDNASSSVCVGEDESSTPSAAKTSDVDGHVYWMIPQKVHRICDPAVAAISAWLVLAIVSL